jgi:hypothetical protein
MGECLTSRNQVDHVGHVGGSPRRMGERTLLAKVARDPADEPEGHRQRDRRFNDRQYECLEVPAADEGIGVIGEDPCRPAGPLVRR